MTSGIPSEIALMNPEAFRRITKYYSDIQNVRISTARRMIELNVRRFIDMKIINKIEEPPFLEWKT